MQARAANRRTDVKPARFFSLSFAFSQSMRAQVTQHDNRDEHKLDNNLGNHVREKSAKNRPKIREKSTKMDEKTAKIQDLVVSGAQGRSGDAPGRSRDGSWTPNNRSKADLGTPRASQERPRAVQKRTPDGPKTFPDRPGAMSECIWSIEHCRTSPRDDLSLFCVGACKLRCAKNVAPAIVLYTSDEVGTDRARTPKTHEHPGVLMSKIEPGSVRATQNRGQAAQIERKSAIEVPLGPPKI